MEDSLPNQISKPLKKKSLLVEKSVSSVKDIRTLVSDEA